MNPAMKQTRDLCYKIFLAICFVCLISAGIAYADEVRKPVYDGSFYPAHRSQLTNYIEQLTDQVKSTHIQHPPKSYVRLLRNCQRLGYPHHHQSEH